MKSSAVACAVLAASFTLGTLSALAQGRVYDRNASNNPEIYRQTHPEDTSQPNLQRGPIRGNDRRDQDQRENARREAERLDAARRGQDRQDNARREHERRDAERREFERRQTEHRRNDQDRRNYGYRNDGYRNDGHRGERYGYVNPERHYHGARGPEFYHGGYIPREFLSQQYYVNDWYGRGLSAPPYGYQWVQIGPDYALIAIATGLIAYLVLTQ